MLTLFLAENTSTILDKEINSISKEPNLQVKVTHTDNERQVSADNEETNSVINNEKPVTTPDQASPPSRKGHEIFSYLQ